MTKRWAIGLVAAAMATTAARAEELLHVETPRGAELAVLFDAPAEAEGLVILFAGGDGVLALDPETGAPTALRNNFLVRSRGRFVEAGYAVALIDAPSDRDRVSARFRMSVAHAEDVGAVIEALGRRVDGPVWLVGTSMGGFSAASVAIELGDAVDGVALASPVTRSRADWAIADAYPNGVLDLALDEIRAPVIVVAHAHDQCEVTSPLGAELLSGAFENASATAYRLVEDFAPTRAPVCHGRSAHGFNGAEAQAVGAIVDFMDAH